MLEQSKNGFENGQIGRKNIKFSCCLVDVSLPVACGRHFFSVSFVRSLEDPRGRLDDDSVLRPGHRRPGAVSEEGEGAVLGVEGVVGEVRLAFDLEGEGTCTQKYRGWEFNEEQLLLSPHQYIVLYNMQRTPYRMS